MIKNITETYVDLIADEGKELYRASDGLRAKRVTRPIGSEEWIEIDEGAEMPSELDAALPSEAEAALSEIERALNG